MYNEKQKKRYLENCKYENTTIETMVFMFDGAAKVETQENMDLSKFNRPQVVDLLKSYNSKSKNYLKFLCVTFADYYNWCLSEGLVDNTNAVNWYDSTLSNTIIDEIIPLNLIKGKFFTKEDVLEYLDKIPDITNKFVLYAMFRGIKGISYSDLVHLRLFDLNEEDKTVKLKSGHIQKVDDLFIQLMKDANNATEYYPDGVVRTYSFNRNVYDDSIYVLKFCGNTHESNEPVSNQTIMNRISLIRKQVGNKFISSSTLYNNGLINYIREHYESKDITLDKALYDEINKKLYTYDKETENVIQEYGSNITVRMLRMQLKDTIKFYRVE